MNSWRERDAKKVSYSSFILPFKGNDLCPRCRRKGFDTMLRPRSNYILYFCIISFLYCVFFPYIFSSLRIMMSHLTFCTILFFCIFPYALSKVCPYCYTYKDILRDIIIAKHPYNISHKRNRSLDNFIIILRTILCELWTW